jgi:hypothetical protein
MKTVQYNVKLKPEVKEMIKKACDGRNAAGFLIEQAVKLYLKKLAEMEEKSND